MQGETPERTTVEATTADTTSSPTTVETTTVDTTSGSTTIEPTTVDTTSVTLSSFAETTGTETTTTSTAVGVTHNHISITQQATAVGDKTNPTCSCACQPTVVKVNLTSQEIAEKAANISRILSVDKKTLSSTIRSKTSAVDNRPSATGVGCVGVVLLAMTIGGIFMLDVPLFLNFAKSIYNTFQIIKQ